MKKRSKRNGGNRDEVKEINEKYLEELIGLYELIGYGSAKGEREV